MHIFVKVAGGKIKERKIKLLEHVVALYSLPIIFSKIFSLATLARLRFILHLEMQACNVLYQTHLYFVSFGVIIHDCYLPKVTENTHKIVHKNVQKLFAGVRRRGWRKRGGQKTWEWGESDTVVGGIDAHGENLNVGVGVPCRLTATLPVSVSLHSALGDDTASRTVKENLQVNGST